MKKIFFFILVSLLPLAVFAQLGLVLSKPSNPDAIVTWKFDMKPSSDNTYLFSATATIEKGYHIFALDAGGDGTLMNTEFEIDDYSDAPVEWRVVPQPKTVVLDYVDGDIYWHENKVTFSKVITLEGDATVFTGTVTYQICNEDKCLPPVTKDIHIELQK